MSELHRISPSQKPSTTFDIVFIHGLGGDAYATWQISDRLDTFWPGLLDRDLPGSLVYSAGFEASPSKWFGSGGMPITDRAVNLLAHLDSSEIGRRPFVFVTHSLGGLLAKQILRTADGYGEGSWRGLIRHLRGIVFLATPHSGSRIADYLQALHRLFRVTDRIPELEANAAPLRDLNLWYRNNVLRLQIRNRIYFETQPTHGIKIVDEASSDPGLAGIIPYPVDADHLNICKPANTDHLVYRGTKQIYFRLC
jgi:pimeloyl-ACP methyl ester carboxylesterase